MSEISTQHRATAAVFTRVVDAVQDWSVPTPVKEWAARDVVDHLATWLPGLLGSGGIELATGPSAAEDPVAAWTHLRDAVQDLLDDPARSGQVGEFPMGPLSAEQAIVTFYEPDVFMHAWDLARASGQDFALDPARCEQMVAGMEPMEDVIRGSGQFGSRVPVPDDADAQSRLLGFIGRDPYWRPPTE